MMFGRVAASWVVVVAGAVVSGCASVSPVTKSADAPDPGYFLSCKQKWQLVSRGQMEDSHKNVYDVLIIPGYVGPARKAKEETLDAADVLGSYIRSDMYLRLADNSVDAFDWAFNDCLVDYAVQGTGNAWCEAFAHAGEVTERRAFGWWLAYPWAFARETVGTAVRVPLGLTGAALGTVWGAVAVPGYFLARPAVESSVVFSFKAVAQMAILSAWNTVVAPPAALVGQKPSPSRVDGYWVNLKRASPTVEQTLMPGTLDYNKDVQALIQWGWRVWERTSPLETRDHDLRAKSEQETKAIQKQLDTALAELDQERQRALSALASEPDMREVLQRLRARGFNMNMLGEMQRDFAEQMSCLGMTNGTQRDPVLKSIRLYPPTNFWDNQPSGVGTAPATTPKTP